MTPTFVDFPTPPDEPFRRSVLAGVLSFELGLGVVGLIAGYLLEIPALGTLAWNLSDAAVGAAAAAPMLAVFLLVDRLPLAPFQRIRAILDEVLAPIFRPLSVWDLATVSLAAGFGEEILFRGFLQAWLTAAWGAPVGWIVGALVFGLAHMATATYAALAAGISLYFSGLWWWTGNLAAPIVAHAVYDFAALLYLMRGRRSGDD